MQRDDAPDVTVEQVEFGDGGGVPEGDEGAAAIAGDHSGVGERTGNALEGGEIEAVDDFAIGDVEEQRFVGTLQATRRRSAPPLTPKLSPAGYVTS